MDSLKIILLSFSFFFLFNTVSYTQALNENFDNGIPSNWAVFDNGLGVNNSWETTSTSFAGDSAAYVQYESAGSIAEDWLVTPQVAITATDYMLSMHHRQSFGSDYGTLYQVRVSTSSQTNPTPFVTLDSMDENSFGTVYEPYLLDLSAYIGQNVYIAFVMIQDDGDDWFIDEVLVGPPPCLDPSSLSTSNISNNSADINWNANGATNWNVQVLQNSTGSTVSSGNVALSSFNANGLSSYTDYTAFVQADCPDNTESLIISGVIDGPLTGGTPKAVELYASGDIPDLGIYGLGSANNGGGTDGVEFTFPSVSVSAGTFIFVTTDSAQFTSYMGFNADYINGSATNVNGDDAVELFKDSVVIDVFGDINVDGNGQPWEYLDGWAYRNNNKTVNAGVFADSNWTFSGINVLDGCSLNSSCGSVFPVGAFTTTVVPRPWVSYAFTTSCDSLVGDTYMDPIHVGSYSYSTSGNTDSCYTDTYGSLSAEVWYRLVLDNCIDTLSVSLCGSSYDTRIVLVASDGSTEIFQNDDDCGAQSRFSLAYYQGFFNPGDTVFIVVEGYSIFQGNYVLSIDQILRTQPTADISYAASSYCHSSDQYSPVNSGTQSGMFSSIPSGISLDTVTGTFTADSLGTFSIIYDVGDNYCNASDTFDVTINVSDTAFILYPGNMYCLNDSNVTPLIYGTTGGNYSSAPGIDLDSLTGEVDISNSSSGIYSVTYHTTSISCPDSAIFTLFLSDVDDASFAYDSSTYCLSGNDPTPILNGTTGGQFSSDSLLVIDSLTGVIDLDASTDTTHTITYTTSGSCPDSFSINITIVGCPTGINTVQKSNRFLLFPNPNNGNFTIVNSGSSGKYQLLVLNVLGESVLERKVTVNQNSTLDVSLNDLTAGTYFVSLKGAELTTFKIQVIP